MITLYTPLDVKYKKVVVDLYVFLNFDTGKQAEREKESARKKHFEQIKGVVNLCLQMFKSLKSFFSLNFSQA